MPEPTPLSFIPAALQTVGGLGQVLFSGVKKANSNLENFANSYKPNESIADFYNKSLANYNANPYNSLSYQNSTNKIQRNLITGIGASQDRRGGLASIGSLVAGANDANANAAARAESASRADLQTLGQAAGMKTREDKVPFDLKYNLLAQKAAAAAKTKQDGLQNLFGGISSAAGLGNQLTGKNKSVTDVPEDTYDYTDIIGKRKNNSYT